MKRLLPFSVSGYMKEVAMPCIFVVLVSIIPSYYINRYVQIHPAVLFFVLFVIACVSIFLLGCTRGERNMILRKLKGRSLIWVRIFNGCFTLYVLDKIY